jgi:hypothetical protein
LVLAIDCGKLANTGGAHWQQSDHTSVRDGHEPFIETDAAEARLAQGHEQVLLDPAAAVSASRSFTIGSAIAFRERATTSLNGGRSGPVISTMPLRGAARGWLGPDCSLTLSASATGLAN